MTNWKSAYRHILLVTRNITAVNIEKNNLLMVTLSSSPSMMLLGVRSRWRIPFSLCRYLSASTIYQYKHKISYQKNHSRQHKQIIADIIREVIEKLEKSSSENFSNLINSTIIYIYVYFILQFFFPPTCINMFQTLSSGNFIFFSFRELKCSPIGAPSMSSITMYNFCSKKKEKKCYKTFW